MTSLVLALLLTGCGTGPAPAGGVVPEQQDAATAPVPADDGPARKAPFVVPGRSVLAVGGWHP